MYTTWKIYNATPMYWFFMAPYYSPPNLGHLRNLTNDFPFRNPKEFQKTPHEPRKKQNLLSIESWLFHDPNNGLFESPQNWVGCHPLHTRNNQGPFFFPCMKKYARQSRNHKNLPNFLAVKIEK